MMEWPKDVSGLVDYVTIDTSVSGFWALEWWAVQPKTMYRYLIWGTRRKMQAGDLLDFNPREMKHVGYMESLMRQSVDLGHPIRVWVIESNAGAKHLFQYDHYRTWRQKWPQTSVLPHETQRNKLDPTFGVEATLPMAYKSGVKRLPRSQSVDNLNFMNVLIRELTQYQNNTPTELQQTTIDTVMADWFGECNLARIVQIGIRQTGPMAPGTKLPPYLMRQQRAVQLTS